MTEPTEIELLRRDFAQQAIASEAQQQTLAERRAAMEAVTAHMPLPTGCHYRETAIGGVPCEELVPAGAKPGLAILYLHGGGYMAGSPRTHRALAARFADATGATTTVIDYRLGPEHPYPAAADDAEAAYRAMLAAGQDPARIVVAGDSAGAGLALTLALRLRDKGLPQPAGYFAISPWADFTQSGASYRSKAGTDPFVSKDRLDPTAQAYLAGADPRDPIASPVFADFSGVAPILIQVGSEEVLLDDAVMVAAAAGASKVEVRLEVWPEMIHVWHAFADRLGDARRAITVASLWMRERLAE